MNLRPYTVARYGIYFALAFAAMSVWLGQQAGASLDFTILRGVFIFIVFTALAFGADAVLTLDVRLAPSEPPAQPAIQGEHSDE
jgi:hypothetical protein